MLLYLLLVIFVGLMTLIALGLTIGGLIKNNKKLWISALVAFVVFSMLSVVSVYTYVKESINYMGSEEFQAETKKKAENLGKTWGNTVSGTAQGLEATLDDDAIAKLANKGAKIVGKGVKAAATGLDETAGKTTVFTDESIDKAGITVGRAEEITDSAKISFGLFLEFKKEFDGKLTLTAFDSKGLKQDNASLAINQQAGKAKVYVFQFDYFKPGLSGYCVLKKD
ncbi:MAG: hypothetical protein U0T84_08115 [Chitinophagales bacterium]